MTNLYDNSWDYSYDPYENGWYGSAYEVGAFSDITPLGVMVPPLGIAQAFGGIGSKGTRSPSSFSEQRSGQPEKIPAGGLKAEIPWFGIAVIVGVGALGILLVYSASNAAEKFAGPIQKQAGRMAGSALGGRYSKTASTLAALEGGSKAKALSGPLEAEVVDVGNRKLLTA